MLSLSSKSEYPVDNNFEFINFSKKVFIPLNHKLISFHVKLLFTNVPLDFTIELLLKLIYEKNETQINIKKKEIKELFPLRKKISFVYKKSKF